jgi:hypothetical protein
MWMEIMSDAPPHIGETMEEIEASASATRDAHYARRAKLVASYRRARTPQKKLQALAKIVRQHGKFMDKNLLCSGWVSRAVIDFAEQIEIVAEEL